jgi:hypothetical protein
MRRIFIFGYLLFMAVASSVLAERTISSIDDQGADQSFQLVDKLIAVGVGAKEGFINSFDPKFLAKTYATLPAKYDAAIE